ncbi:hypothetical protein CLIB1444_03S10814 [[Candida] jaroonii]|uniref:Uncharacterized protein n=1 Tax=[Candida] jaroonii TaxID=467808 RepID=A0ACA9Y5Y6_9ASCO|nr:hypothetical protein CLIB1444_03S10814 [[Candida] jaroonii]
MNQCLGITTKGQRCKIRSNDKFCHYHVQQDMGMINKHVASTEGSNIVDKKPSSGFIYIYTLHKFFGKETNWFKAHNLPDHKDEYKFSKSSYIFLKVGMTTQTISTRIKQWENKCKHQIYLVNPETDKILRKTKLTDLFKRLRISHYETFKDGGFYSHNLALAEKEIHQKLHKLYGKGIIYCKNCGEDKYNIHVEWFLIPKKHLQTIYKLIDEICWKYTKQVNF